MDFQLLHWEQLPFLHKPAFDHILSLCLSHAVDAWTVHPVHQISEIPCVVVFA